MTTSPIIYVVGHLQGVQTLLLLRRSCIYPRQWMNSARLNALGWKAQAGQERRAA